MANHLSHTDVVCVVERNAKWRATETLWGGYNPLRFIRLFWPLVHVLLKTFLSILFSLIGSQRVEQKSLNSNERSFVWASGEAFEFLFSLNWLATSPRIAVEFGHF